MPGPCLALRRRGVARSCGRRRAAARLSRVAKPAQHRVDAFVIRVEERAEPDAGARIRSRSLVAGNRPAVAFGAKGLRVVGAAIAVDDQARVAREHGRRIERVRKTARQFAGADVPGDVLPAAAVRAARAGPAPRERAARVVADDQGRAGPCSSSTTNGAGSSRPIRGHAGGRVGRSAWVTGGKFTGLQSGDAPGRDRTAWAPFDGSTYACQRRNDPRRPA